MPDFTLSIYRQLIAALRNQNYTFQCFYDFVRNPAERVIILRHDVDRAPHNALAMAELENSMGLRASYYFRIVPSVFEEHVIRKIASLGHEIGYHYEDISIAARTNTNDDLLDVAIKNFRMNLERLRELYPVKTVCMHGSPLSKYDNRMLWDRYNYRDFGIVAEPYFDLDFNEVLYLTDASRGWNNEKSTIRDKVDSSFNIKPKSTFDIIKLSKSEELPNQIMINIHPHNWTGSQLEWIRIYVWQSMKNVIKIAMNNLK